MKKKVNLAIFASGSGTNAQRICEYFDGHDDIHVSLILSNKKDAYVLERAKKLGIPSVVVSASELRDMTLILDVLKQYQIDFLVLAGFLVLLPAYLIQAFPGRIVNIHPALLPKYGGKGMYGHHVHDAVIASGDSSSGVTIHYVNENYDEGSIIFQAFCPVMPDDTPDTLAARIHELEYKFFPVIIEKIILMPHPSPFTSHPI